MINIIVSMTINKVLKYYAGTNLARGIDDKTVNLSVTCNKTVAHLNWSSGGLSVIGIRLAQQCIAQDKHNESTLPSEV